LVSNDVIESHQPMSVTSPAPLNPHRFVLFFSSPEIIIAVFEFSNQQLALN